MKKKVLMISCGGLGNGGVQSVMYSIVKELSSLYDFDILVFNKKENDYYESFFHNYGCNIFNMKKFIAHNIISRMFSSFINYFLFLFQFKKFLRIHSDYDIIHCHNYFEAAPFVFLASIYDIPIRISHSHNVKSPFEKKNIIRNFVQFICRKQIVKYSTNLVACSNGAGHYLFGNSKFDVIHNAIDLNKFSFSNFISTSNHKHLRFINVGRFSLQKNQLFLLDVFYEIHNLHFDSELILIGFGELENEIRNKIHSLNLDDCVFLLPHDSDVCSELKKSNAMIFPSTYEGLGISLIEAQSIGLKCYVSDKIQPEADLGNLFFISLSSSSKCWANDILNDILPNSSFRKKVDMSSYDINKISYLYCKLYEGGAFFEK